MSDTVAVPRLEADTAATRPPRRDAARNRALLLDAARVVFAKRGLDATLDDVARTAQVGIGTAYRHFANKYELATAVFTQEIEHMVAVAEDLAEMDDPWQAITLFITTAVEAQIQDRGLREVLTGVHDEDQFREVNQGFSRPLNRLVNRARESGCVRPDVAPSDIGVVTMMLCAVSDVAGDRHPTLWRRYLPMLMSGLTDQVAVEEAALSEQAFQEAMNAHKGHKARHASGAASRR